MEVNGESIELTGEDAEAEGCSQGALTVYDVANLLRRRYVIITGGRGGLGCPILTFPDTDSCGDAELPCWVSDDQFRQLIIYLTSLPTLNDADAGFVLVIDRRTARWSSLKAALLHISAFFPGLISVCYVLRPCGFIQGTWTDIGYKFSRDDFKFKIVICSSLNELHSYIDRSQLTRDLGGEIPHNQNQWIQQRMEVEKFSLRSHGVSELLNQFIGQLKCSELPVDVATSENMLKSQTQTYDQLKRHLLAVAERGEVQLMDIRQQSCPTGDCNAQSRYTSDILINVTTIERLATFGTQW